MTQKEFKVGDTVYYGTLKAKVTRQENDDSDMSLEIDFEDGEHLGFTKDGRYYKNTPIVLSHFPYEIEYKKVEPKIEKDTPVYYRDKEDTAWMYGYYSHFEDGFHQVFIDSKKSTETNEFLSWNIATTENPLK